MLHQQTQLATGSGKARWLKVLLATGDAYGLDGADCSGSETHRCNTATA